jgi:hypothetical protein
VISPLFYSRPLEFAAVRRSTIALNGSFFTAQRMMGQYLINAYLPVGESQGHDPGAGAGPSLETGHNPPPPV